MEVIKILYITNGFSDSMKRDINMVALPYVLTKEQFIDIIQSSEFVSVIGHDNIADYISELTGIQIEKNRKGILLNYDDEVITISFNGRLPEHIHKNDVELDNRANFTYKRFIKQSTEDLIESEERINEMIKI